MTVLTVGAGPTGLTPLENIAEDIDAGGVVVRGSGRARIRRLPIERTHD